jgi:hypothetical protein
MEKPWYKSYAKGIPHNLNYEKTTVPEALRRTVQDFPEKTALIFLDVRISYRQLDEILWG